MLNHTQIIIVMIMCTVAGLTAWFYAFRSYSAPVPNQDDAPEPTPVDFREYRGYWD